MAKYKDSPETELVNAQKIAENIRDLHDKLQADDTIKVDPSNYMENYQYEVFCAALRRAGFAISLNSTIPTAEEQAIVDPLLNATGMSMMEVYEKSKPITKHMAKTAWEAMKAHSEWPNHAMDYFMLHNSIEELGIASNSDEMLEIIGANREEFSRVNKMHALCAIHGEYVFAGLPLVLSPDTLSESSFKDAIEGIFNRMNNFVEETNDSIEKIRQEAGLTEQEVRFYIEQRIAFEKGQGNSDKPDLAH